MTLPMLAPALSVTNLALSSGGVQLVHPATFAIGPGERVALVGASGSGKSLTAAALAGTVPDGVMVTGDITFAPAVQAGPGARNAALIRQDPSTMLNPLVPVGKQLAMPLRRTAGRTSETGRSEAGRFEAGRFEAGRPEAGSSAAGTPEVCRPEAGRGRSTLDGLGLGRLGLDRLGLEGRRLSRRDAYAEAGRLLERAGLDDAARILPRYTGELSGGQLQRVCIALALACGSPVLVADEPTTALDAVTRLKVLDTLRTWGTEGRSLLFITHDLAAAASLCSRALVMAEGRIVEDTTMQELLRNPQHPYARRLVQAAQGTSPLLTAAA